MRVNANAGGDYKVTSGGIALEVDITNSTESHATRAGLQRSLRRRHDLERKIDVMRQRIRRTHGQNRQRGGGVGEHLDDVVDGAIAPAGENGVATGGDSTASFFDGVIRRLRGNQIGFHASGPKHRDRGFQFALALLAAAGFRVVKQRSLAHGWPKGDCNVETAAAVPT